MKRIVIVLFLLLLIPLAASAEDFYLTLSGAGAQTGANCANAKPASFFNTVGNWGAGAGLISPGDTAHICGTWTGGNGAQFLVFQGNGTAGNIITLFFEPGAILQAPYFSGTGAIYLNNFGSYTLIDGGATCGFVNRVAVPVANCNGTIRTTNNGTNLTFQQASDGVYSGLGANPTNLEIRNLVIHLYDRVDTHSSVTPDGQSTGSIIIDHSGAINTRIHHNHVTGNRNGILFNLEGQNPDGIHIYNNYVADITWGITVSSFGENSIATNVQIHDNEITNWDNWTTPTGAFHQNGIFTFTNCTPNDPCVNGHIGDAISKIYNNYIHGDLSGGFSGSSTSGFIQLSDASVFTVFNNILYCPPGAIKCGYGLYLLACNGIPCGGDIKYYNNTQTFSGHYCMQFDTSSPPVLLKNNIFGGGCNGIEQTRAGKLVTGQTSDYNIGFNLAFNRWVEDGDGGAWKTLAQYQASPYFQELHSSTANPLLDANYKLTTGSPAIGTGTNLTSLGITELNVDAAGVARPASGPWDIGAFQFGSTPDTTPPAAPTGVMVSQGMTDARTPD